ncbi:MAG: Ig-like domain-containing protein [Deinococcales bacterium]
MPLPAPRLLLHSPAPGEEQPLDAPIELTFDQQMDRETVEQAFRISPTVKGQITWLDDRTFSFEPGAELERGARYSVMVEATAANTEGKQLEEPVSFEFDTVGFLEITQVMPASDSGDLDPDTVVTVVFNRPVVPLAAISQQGELPQPLTFVPPVQGRGEWLNTAIYLFTPADGLLPGTHYKARVAAGLADTTGAVLEEDYTWEFETIRPAILQVSPPEDFVQVGPTDIISVTFNQPVDHTSAQSRFSLEMDGQPVAGTFRWDGGQTPIQPETMLFVPDKPLPRDTAYSAAVAAGVQGQAGNTGTEGRKSWVFSTVQQPGIESTWPRDGARRVQPGTGVVITFASPMQREGFLDHISIRPAVTEVNTSWLENDTQVGIEFQSEPATAYQVSLDAATPDRYGVPLGDAARIRFTTGDLPAYASLTTVGRLGAVSAYTDTVVYATYRNVSSLQMSLYRLSVGAFMDLNTSWEAWDQFVPGEAELVRRWSTNVEAPRNEARLERLLLLDADGAALPPGLYYLQLTSPEVQRLQADGNEVSRYIFVRSRLNLTLKQTRSEALVWATDLASGQPVSDLSLALYSNPDEMQAVSVTDAGGLAIVGDLPLDDLWSPFFAVVGELGEDDFGIAYNGWEEGINPWDFGVESEFWGTDYQGYLYTDRPIYRPGQTVYFKGIVRADDDAVYSVPGEIESVHVHVNDGQGNELYRQELSLSDMGTFYDELVLDEQASLGDYYVDIQEPDLELYAGTTFRVAEYEAPEFQVAVTPARDAYLAGETIAVTAEATYYFGGPVADADVADCDGGVVVAELTRRQLVGLGDAHHQLDAVQRAQMLPHLFGRGGADGADQGALLALADVGGEAQRSDLAEHAIDGLGRGLLLHHDDHGGLLVVPASVAGRCWVGSGRPARPMDGGCWAVARCSLRGSALRRRGAVRVRGDLDDVAIAIVHGTTPSSRKRHGRESTRTAPAVKDSSGYGARRGAHGSGRGQARAAGVGQHDERRVVLRVRVPAHLRVPLHRHHEGLVGVGELEGLHDAVRAPGRHLEAVSDPVDRLVVEAVDGQLRLAEGAGEARSRGEGDALQGGSGEVLLQVLLGVRHGGQVLVQVASVRHVDELDASADPQDGLAQRSEGSVQRELEGVAAPVYRAEVAVRPRPEQVGIDVDAPGQQQAVRASRVGVGQLGIHVGRHQRHGAGRRQREGVVVALDDVVTAQPALARHRPARHQDDRLGLRSWLGHGP